MVKRISENEIIKILKTGETGVPVPELCRQYGIGKSTYYKWKAKYGGLDLSELKRLKRLEEENRKLKKMYADISLDNLILKEALGKKD